jgi:hypothetical protein
MRIAKNYSIRPNAIGWAEPRLRPDPPVGELK